MTVQEYYDPTSLFDVEGESARQYFRLLVMTCDMTQII